MEKNLNLKSDFVSVARGIILANFIYAKTMPQFPHWYTLKKDWKDPKAFEDVVMYIREHGYNEPFQGRDYTKFNLNGWKYWTMGAQLKDTILINKARLSIESPYNGKAEKYDSYFDKSQYRAEDMAIISKMDIKGRVLDIGCGTGLLLDYVKPQEYIGIDPSRDMLVRLQAKRPEAKCILTRFEEFWFGTFDTIVSLYGSISYVDPLYICRVSQMLKPGGKAYLMFYADDYEPLTHSDITGHIPIHRSEYSSSGERIGNYNLLTIEKHG